MSELEQWLEKAQNFWRKSRMRLRGLASGPRVTPEQLASDDAATRWRGVRSLLTAPQPTLLPTLLSLADDADPMVRAAVVDVLTSWGSTIVLSSTRRTLVAQPGPAAATTLLEVLAHLPAPENRSAILPFLAHEDEAVRAAALTALAALCDDNDVAQLREAWEAASIAIQRAIIAGLCAPAAESWVQEALTADDPVLRQRAIQAMPRIQRQAALQRQQVAPAQKEVEEPDDALA
ncbi:MAG: hypothetical protein DSY55_00215 [Clostridia bacterium]|nr:MAG: hypothetical protein DSY55_00215 [Clostridia bacterium]